VAKNSKRFTVAEVDRVIKKIINESIVNNGGVIGTPWIV
jgi:hypothetical protein